MTLNAAVVGAGVVSGTHLSALERNPRTNLVAICDIDEGRATDVATKHDIKAYTDIDEMLEAEDLDWVHICTSVQTHVSLAKKVIDKGIPVMIEKPITTTLDEFLELQEYAEERGVRFSEVHQHAFDPAMRVVTERMKRGDLGRIRSVEVIFTGLTPPDLEQRGSWTMELDGGEFEEGLPHPLYLALTAGGYPESEDAISAITSLANDYEHDFTYDNASVQYRTNGGCLVSVKMISGAIPQRLVVVHGEKRSLMADLVSQTVMKVAHDPTSTSLSKVRYNVERSADLIGGVVGNASTVLKTKYDDGWENLKQTNPHYYQIDLESRAIASGRPMPVPIEESMWTMVLLEAVREAARQN
ncbi:MULTISPECIES: Gfo/Idh/MocA family protein [Haloferax]|uniref:Gfo/Idh/MocA family oxidoreductase n=2 Tax=Haloferax TaxID=2251 RepID=A0A6G1Z709_9EURY|nr:MULTISPECIES: Gfo/Idh/MocA family oxidoreductase [Haloferax]KAB1185162.1 Gfo/Idh/MocA family oxidoreductase [Haloferax sp. CBA1149]MRW82340.1 gfo/Idh/MocA family oxidoreductase [Haloferax marinisediminis]